MPAARLVDRDPVVPRDRLLADLVPPPHFASVSFDGYRADPAQPTQERAVELLRAFAARLGERPSGSGLRRLLGRGGRDSGRPGVYLDGGFGVGKTHLLAALWHAAPAPKAFGTFVEYTNLVGALGFREAVTALSTNRLVCVDEFELDDPGDTVLMARLLRELADAGVRLAATSNTLPDALGEGRFAADDFLREIQAVAGHFDVVRIDGDDYRHRGNPVPPEPLPDDDVAAAATGGSAVVDEFHALTAHLATVHPSRYGALLDGVAVAGWRGVEQVEDQNVALRLVALVDRMYDRDVVLRTSGVRLDGLFTEAMLEGGYRKKYRRALSRLTAMARADLPA
ncbi:cell division protein ZapE [Angustibacter speluncae]